MKSLLVILTLTISAQTFASDCFLPNTKPYISADKVSCDDTTNQVLIEGIKIKKFNEEKSALVNVTYKSTQKEGADDICKSFGLSSAEALSYKTIYSYLNTGYLVKIESSAENSPVNIYEAKQTSRLSPVKAIICNR